MALAMPVFRPKQSARLAATVELAAADVDVALVRLAERDDAGVQAMDQGAEGQEIERARLAGECSVPLLMMFVRL